MSRDPGERTSERGERADRADRGERADRGDRDAELLTAYVDGVTELSPDERRRAAALLERDPGARADEAAVRSLLDQLRGLPAEGSEPDWAAMERSIDAAVGREVPRPWWRSWRWRWLAPSATLATATIVLLVMWQRPAVIEPPAGSAGGSDGAHRPGLAHEPPATPDDFVALWLDGAEIDVALSASDLLGDALPGDDEPALPDAAADAAGDPALGLLPTAGLAWVDRLDDAALSRAERWLADETSPSPGPGPSPALAPGGKG